MPSRRSFPNRVLITVGIVAASLLTLYLFVVLSRVLLIVFAGVLLAFAAVCFVIGVRRFKYEA